MYISLLSLQGAPFSRPGALPRRKKKTIVLDKNTALTWHALVYHCTQVPNESDEALLHKASSSLGFCVTSATKRVLHATQSRAACLLVTKAGKCTGVHARATSKNATVQAKLETSQHTACGCTRCTRAYSAKPHVWKSALETTKHRQHAATTLRWEHKTLYVSPKATGHCLHNVARQCVALGLKDADLKPQDEPTFNK